MATNDDLVREMSALTEGLGNLRQSIDKLDKTSKDTTRRAGAARRAGPALGGLAGGAPGAARGAGALAGLLGTIARRTAAGGLLAAGGAAAGVALGGFEAVAQGGTFEAGATRAGVGLIAAIPILGELSGAKGLKETVEAAEKATIGELGGAAAAGVQFSPEQVQFRFELNRARAENLREFQLEVREVGGQALIRGVAGEVAVAGARATVRNAVQSVDQTGLTTVR